MLLKQLQLVNKVSWLNMSLPGGTELQRLCWVSQIILLLVSLFHSSFFLRCNMRDLIDVFDILIQLIFGQLVAFWQNCWEVDRSLKEKITSINWISFYTSSVLHRIRLWEGSDLLEWVPLSIPTDSQRGITWLTVFDLYSLFVQFRVFSRHKITFVRYLTNLESLLYNCTLPRTL